MFYRQVRKKAVIAIIPRYLIGSIQLNYSRLHALYSFLYFPKKTHEWGKILCPALKEKAKERAEIDFFNVCFAHCLYLGKSSAVLDFFEQSSDIATQSCAAAGN